MKLSGLNESTMLGMGMLGSLREKADYGLKCKWKVSVGFLLS